MQEHLSAAAHSYGGVVGGMTGIPTVTITADHLGNEAIADLVAGFR